MAKSIEMPFGFWTRVGPRKHVLHGGAYLLHLTNTTEASMFGGPAKTAEPIEMPFGVWTQGPRNRVLDGVQIPPREGASFRGRATNCRV